MKAFSMTLFSAATLTANATGSTFRQRDVRFFFELFSNWMSSWFEQNGQTIIHNTQIMRELRSLTQQGLIKQLNKSSKAPTYRLNRAGVTELCRSLRNTITLEEPQLFFFFVYFVRSYKEVLGSMIRNGEDYPKALLTEVEYLLDEQSFKRIADELLKHEIKKLTIRIEEAKKAQLLANRSFAQGLSPEEVSAIVEKKFPYDLNSVRSFSELIQSIPENLRKHELTTGIELRAELLWASQRAILRSYVDLIRAF